MYMSHSFCRPYSPGEMSHRCVCVCVEPEDSFKIQWQMCKSLFGDVNVFVHVHAWICVFVKDCMFIPKIK